MNNIELETYNQDIIKHICLYNYGVPCSNSQHTGIIPKNTVFKRPIAIKFPTHYDFLAFLI